MEPQKQTVQGFLEAVASKSPTPGGGAVASVTAALAAALGRMVLNYSVEKKTLAAHEPANRTKIEQLKLLGERFLGLARNDAEAYAALNELWKLRDDDARRVREFPGAVDAAIAAPTAVMDAARDMLEILQSMAGTTNAMLASDLAIAAVLAEAAIRAAAWNVRINLPLLTDARRREQTTSEIHAAISQARTMTEGIERRCMPASK